MEQTTLKLFLMVILTIFAFASAGFGAWLTKKALKENSEPAGTAAVFAFVATGALLLGIANVAGVQLK